MIIQNNLIRRVISVFIIITLLFTGFFLIPNFSFAATKTETGSADIEDLAYYDIWKHEDDTWQNGKKQGSSVSQNYTISESLVPSGAKITGITGEFNNNYNGLWLEYCVTNESSSVFGVEYKCSIGQTKQSSSADISYTVSTALISNKGLNGWNIKEPWQAPNVEGYRYYIPIVFHITYTYEVEIGDFQPDLDLPSSAKQGESYTASDATTVDSSTTIDHAVLEKHNGDGDWETVTTWNGTGSPGENTGGSISGSCDEICTITYRLTVYDTSGQSKSVTKTIDITDGREVDGQAILELPEYTYEGHPALAKDVSVFKVDGVNYSARRAYEEDVADNVFIPVPSASGSAKKETLTTANVTFPKRGSYQVKLEVNTISGSRLTDIKPIVVRKTPYILENLGGFQKENRKQILDIAVATYPGKPITDYYVELTDLKTNQTITLTTDNPQVNNATIKTRAITSKAETYWTNFELLFLTKNTTEQKYQYTIFMKDSKGDTDIVQKIFTVNPDLPPNPVIVMQDSFIRNKGTNIAEIITEDASTTDGDQLERTWSIEGKNIKTIDEYKDLAFGTGQKVQFNKTGVGKLDVALSLKDIWIEPTLEEYITDADYKTATITKTTDVINIAPTVRLEPINTKEADIVILTDKAHKTEIGATINTLKAALIEKGFDPHINLAVAPNADEGSYRKVASWAWDTTVNCSICQQNSGQMDSDYVYRITSPGKYVDGYQERCVADQPHVLQALSAGTTANSGYVAWSYPVNESRSFTFYLDNKEKYVYIVCYDTNKTIVLNRDNGAYLTTLNIAIPGVPFINDDAQNLYFLGSSTITKYDTSLGTYSTVMNRGGALSQMMDGNVVFVGKKESSVKQNKNGCGFYIGKFDMNTETVEEITIPELPKTSGEVSPMDIDNKGKVLLKQGSNVWVADTQNQTVKMTNAAGIGDHMNSTVFVKNEKGEGVYVAHAYNNTDYKSRSYFYFSLYDFSGSGLTGVSGYGSSRYYGYNWNGISYAKLHSKENKIYIMQGNVFDNLSGSTTGFLFRIDVPTMGIDRSPSSWGWDVADESGAYNGSLMRTFYTLDRWTGMSDRINLFRNSITELDAKTYALRQNAQSGNNDSEKYVIVAGDDAAEQILNSQEFKNEIDLRGARSFFYDVKDSIGTIADQIEDLGDNLKNFLLLEGDRTANLASIEHDIQLQPNVEYEYQYNLATTGKAIDLFGVKNPNSQGLENDGKYFEKTAAFINFNSGLTEPFFTMSGGGTGSWDGYGTDTDVYSNAAYTASFTMEKDGYVSFDVHIAGTGYKSATNILTYSVDGKQVGSDGITGYTALNEPRIIYLSSGLHTIYFLHSCSYVFGAAASINNLKAVYYEDTADAFSPATITGSDNREMQTVSNSFRISGQEGMEVTKEITNFMTTKTGVELSKYISSSSWYEVEYWDSVKKRYYWQYYTGSPFSYNESTSTYSYEGPYERAYPTFHITAPPDKFLIYSYNLSFSGGRNNKNTSEQGERLYPGTEVRILRPGKTQKLSAELYYYNKGAYENRAAKMYVSNIKIAEFDASDFDGTANMQTIATNVQNRSVYAPGAVGTSSLLFTIDEATGSVNIKYITDLPDSASSLNNGIRLSTSESAEKISALVSNFSLYQKIGGIKQLIFSQNFNSQNALDLTGWHSSAAGDGKVEIVAAKPPAQEEDAPLIYKKGQLVSYNMFYDDYENDPSKKQYWRYTHTPMNDGPNPQAAFILDEDGNVASSTGAILTQTIPRFYIDGKYTVEHWQEDNTNRTGDTSGETDYTKYDKLSNVESITFYIEGGGLAPWITSIKTIPPAVKEGDQYQLKIGVDDAEKDILRLTTEVYKDKKLIYTHKQLNITADGKGNYPYITTSCPPLAEPGKYDVVCTVRDWSGAGLGSYKFTVISEGKITGFVNHTDQWDENRKKYNLKRFSEEVNRTMQLDDYLAMSIPRKRGTNVFWSGEKFMLRSETEGKPTSVKVQVYTLDSNGNRKSTDYSTELSKTGRKTASGAELWEGSLWDQSMINKWGRKAPEQLLFSFTAYYSGGLTKSNDVCIIVDSKQDYWQLHRLW